MLSSSQIVVSSSTIVSNAFHATPASTFSDPSRCLPTQVERMHLVTSSSALSNDTLELVDLGLSTTESTEPLLCELTGTLVLAVAEKFDDTTLIWGETVQRLQISLLSPGVGPSRAATWAMDRVDLPSDLLDNLSDESSLCAQGTLASADSRLRHANLGFLFPQTLAR